MEERWTIPDETITRDGPVHKGVTCHHPFPPLFSLYRVSFCLLLSWISIGKTLDHKNLLFFFSLLSLPLSLSPSDATSETKRRGRSGKLGQLIKIEQRG